MNEIITLANPNGSQETITAARRMLMERQHADVAAIEEGIAALATDGIKGHTRKAFDETAKLYTDAGKKLAADIAKATGADAIFTQLTASAALVKDAVKAYQTRWDEAKAATEPPAPKHTYILRLTCTDAVLAKVAKDAVKAGAEDVVAATPQGDAEIRKICAWFERNV